jgi:hypothetical protein
MRNSMKCHVVNKYNFLECIMYAIVVALYVPVYYEESWVTRMFVLKKSVYLWDVPLSVRLGYFINFGPLCAAIWYASRWI